MITLSGTSFVTTDPAPTITFWPIVTPHIMVALDPIDTPFFTNVGTQTQSSSVCNEPSGFIALGYLSLINVTYDR